MPTKFWIVWNGKRDGTPTYQHPSPESATHEAERLTCLSGGTFHVMEVVASCRRVEWEKYDRDDLPF